MIVNQLLYLSDKIKEEKEAKKEGFVQIGKFSELSYYFQRKKTDRKIYFSTFYSTFNFEKKIFEN